MRKKEIIKSKEIKDLLKLWAKYNEIQPEQPIQVMVSDWDHGGICLINGVISFYSPYYRLSLDIFRNSPFYSEIINLSGNKTYTLKELLKGADNA